MSRSVGWWIRAQLGADGRRRARKIVDFILSPVVGSVQATGATHGVAITLDDGPDPLVTAPLLAALDIVGVRCTFFLLVEQCRLHPELLEAIMQGGHEIALHGDDHRRITRMRHSVATRYLQNARRELELLSGAKVKFYRPPYGSQSLRSYLAVRRAGLQVVVWSADAADWVDRQLDDVVFTGLGQLTAGGILLLHERLEPDPERGASPTTSFDRVDLVLRTIAGAGDRSWRAGTVGDLIADHGSRKSAWFRP